MPAEFAELELGELGELGDTIAEFEGSPINVAGGIPGERAVVRIYRYRRRRKDIVSGIVSRVIEPSPHRVAPRCGYCGPCSGCQWQHIAYPVQLQFKREEIEAAGHYDSLRDVRLILPTPARLHQYYIATTPGSPSEWEASWVSRTGLRAGL